MGFMKRRKQPHLFRCNAADPCGRKPVEEKQSGSEESMRGEARQARRASNTEKKASAKAKARTKVDRKSRARGRSR